MARFDETKAYMLYRVYQEVYDSGSLGALSAVDIERLAAGGIGNRIATRAVDALLTDGLLDGQIGNFDITASGIKYVEEQLEDPMSDIAKLAKRLEQAPGRDVRGTDTLSEAVRSTTGVTEPSLPLQDAAAKGETAGAGTLHVDTVQREDPIHWDVSRLLDVPASDRIVTLDHNGGPYKEAIASLERVIREFRDDHHLGNQFGSEKTALIQTLEAGRELLGDTQVRISSVVATVVSPLKILINRYRGAIATGVAEGLGRVAVEAICKAASAALDAVIKLFS